MDSDNSSHPTDHGLNKDPAPGPYDNLCTNLESIFTDYDDPSFHTGQSSSQRSHTLFGFDSPREEPIRNEIAHHIAPREVVFSQKSSRQPELVKENKGLRAPLSGLWVLAALAASAATLAAVARIDHALPAPLGPHAPSARFHALTAHRHLVNLTALGPRVAGSYENEVLAVGVLVSALRHIAAHASPHNLVELDVHTASGAFPLAFMDGMNNVYRGVQSVVARVRGAGGRARARSALLLNCHFDSVPDSPGASDDGAGCAVLLETMRALVAGGPLRHDAVFLFNGAEENIMQASHAFITQHKWAKDVRAFINIEACGAGGREVLFQAGPHDPWIVEMYAGAVPHPFASSLAQELFESGLIPADTDFRIFRDFGKLSGVDLAWSANGYVYHTRLDTPERVPPAALQRTGDNVLALAQGLLASESLESEPDASSRQPVFFDVLGLAVVSVRAPAALLLAAGALALALLKVQASAGQARAALCVRRGAWWRAVGRAALAGAAAQLAGVLTATAPALLLHATGARLCFYSRGALLAPLYALPALAGTWAAAARLWGTPALLRGWWAARAWHDAAALAWAALLLLCAARGLRSGFLPLLWALLPAAADLLGGAAGLAPGARAALWALGAALPAAQTWYLALGSLHMFVPLMGRAGAGALPADVSMAALVALLVQASCSWLLPLALAARGVRRLARAAAALCAGTLLLVLLTPLGAPYSAERPQRLMVFHTRRTLHAPLVPTDRVDHFYWVPELDANTPHSVDKYVPEMRQARPVSAADCARLLYCGAPYYLPVLTLIARSHAAPAPSAPLPRLTAALTLARHNATALELSVQLSGPPHAVLLLAPARGVRLAWSSALAELQPGAAWGARRSYFVALHDARAGEAGAAWRVSLLLTHAPGLQPPHWADVSLGGHALFGRQARAPAHDALLRALPPWVAATGWGVDLHLYRV